MTECHNGIVIEKHWLKWEKVHKIKESTRSKPQVLSGGFMFLKSSVLSIDCI